MTVDYRVGDTRQLIRDLPDGSVDLIASSPPFIALRSYLPADHPDKAAEIGSEPDPATFIDTLLELVAEWGRVLAPHGSIAIELGDSYSGSGGGGGDYLEGGLREGQAQFAGSAAAARESNAEHWRQKNQAPAQWPRAKSLALIPQLFAVALAYGRHPLTGAESPAGQWLVRNVIVWHRPNPAVGALGDKVRPSTSYIVVATRSPKRYFDLTAIRTPIKAAEWSKAGQVSGESFQGGDGGYDHGRTRRPDPAGAPPLDAWFDNDDHDLWTLTTQPSKLCHYAMWPAKLAERLILSMCPARVCEQCGQPSRRIEQANYIGAKSGRNYTPHVWASGDGATHAHTNKAPDEGALMVPITTGWTDCGHGEWRKGVTLDPFCGTGTSAIVADLHGRTGIGFDLDARNFDLVAPRTIEVRRNLFGTQPELPGQLDIFEEAS